MIISGIEKHPTLQSLLIEIEESIRREKVSYVKLNLRKCAEYIVGQYIREYPAFAGGSLYDKICRLEKVIDESDVHLLHSLRMMGNRGGAHLEEAEDDFNSGNEADDFSKALRTYNELLEYLPGFFNKFPEQSKKPAPKVGKVFEAVELNIDYSNIKVLHLHTGWWKRLRYNYMCDVLEDPYYNYCVYEHPELYSWIWIPRLMEQMKVIYTGQGSQEYLDLPKLVKYYEEVVTAFSKNDFSSFYSQYGDSHQKKFCQRDYFNDTNGIHIPGIIQQYFPGETCYREEGKNTCQWIERNENRIYMEYNILVHGQRADWWEWCTSLDNWTDARLKHVETPIFKRYRENYYVKPKPLVTAKPQPKTTVSEEEIARRRAALEKQKLEKERKQKELTEQTKHLFEELVNMF